MITRAQLQKLAKEYAINEFIVAREFIQITFLKELYQENFAQEVFFKGGTAIRLLYGGKRFSENLDFTVQQSEDKFRDLITRLFSKLENQYLFKFKERDTLTGLTFLLTATLPFLKSEVFVRLDFSMRENALEPVKNIIETDYPIILQSFIHSLSKNEILAEKIRAILKREKHRDLYDLWILQELGSKLDRQLIKEKLAYYGEEYSPGVLLERLQVFSREDFIKDLRPFVPANEKDQLGQLFEYVQQYLHQSFARV